MNVYKIETERLIIRCYQPKDASMLKDAIDSSLDHLTTWMPWAIHEPETIEAKIDRLRKFRAHYDLNQDYTYGIFDKEETKLIGSAGLHTRQGKNVFEIGYWIRASEVNKGYANEATLALIKLGFLQPEIQRIEIHCEPSNERSSNIPKKLGFTLEAILKNRCQLTDGQFQDSMIWTLFRKDYETSDLVQLPFKYFDALDRLTD